MTEDLTKLLAEATPGPWKVFIDDSGGEWCGWPLSIECEAITDKTVVRTGGQWPYEWDAKTSQHEACQTARLIALAPDLAAQVIYLAALLEEADRQLAYLDDRSPSGTTPAVRAKIRAALNPTGEA